MMTPKLFIQLFIIALSVFLFSSCTKDSSVTVPPTALHGVYVSYENAHVGGSDYAYIDIDKDTVYNNVYENANGTAFIDGPGKITLRENRYIYMVCAGSGAQGGGMYEVNSSNNQLIKYQQFGNAPRSFVIDNGNMFVSSSGGSYATKLDISLNVLNDYIDVGPQPGGVSVTAGRIFICKSAVSSVKVLSVVNEASLLVTPVNLSFVPLSLVNNTGGYYLTGSGKRFIYHLDSVTLNPIDSISIATAGSSLGNLVNEGQLKMLAVVDSSEVWEINLTNYPPTTKLLILFPGGRFKISALGYEDITNMIYVVDNDGGPPYFGIVHVYDPSSGLQVKYYSLVGRNPASLAFKY